MTLSIPDLDPEADMISAALAYARAGWYCLPVNPRTKHPGSVVGKNWPAKSSREPAQLAAWFAGSNDSLALHCGRSGAVVFDADKPQLMPSVLLDEIERAKPPFQASRVNDDKRGHYLFLQPPGRSIGNSGGGLGGTWGEVRGKNGVFIAAPTPHIKASVGGRYYWLLTGELPILGASVADLMPDQSDTGDAASDAEVEAFLLKHRASVRPELIEGVATRFRADLEAGQGRHPSAVTAVCWAMREARAGLYDARSALAVLWPIFRDSLRDESSRRPKAEWLGIVAWAMGQSELDDAAVTLDRLTAPEPLAGEEMATEASAEPESRIVDLGPFLDGTYVPPMPSVGGERDDCRRLLYPSRWHSVVGLTAAGKSWLGLWHAAETMRAGGTVVYFHFEEAIPTGTLARLRKMGCTSEMIRAQFIWLDCSRRWSFGDFPALLGKVNESALVILDGINAACSIHGWPVDKPEAIGAYRAMFVTPATTRGAAVLSLGHPPKSRDRQGERHGFGSTAWLDEVDGVAFRLEASKNPIGRGRTGRSVLYSVKDRYGEVEAFGQQEEKREAGWYYQGSLEVDDARPSGITVIRLSTPSPKTEGLDATDQLGNEIVRYLASLPDPSFESANTLQEHLGGRGRLSFDKNHLRPALDRLEAAGRLVRAPYVNRTAPRGGHLPTSLEVDLDDADD